MIIGTLLASFVLVVHALSIIERNELSRKFKYYFSSVSPTSAENFVTGRNGTFFSVETEIHLLSSTIKIDTIDVDIVVSFSWIDDRLVLRELRDRLEMPSEFSPWTPRLRTFPGSHSQSMFLSPTTGAISWYHRVKDELKCDTEVWKKPFQSYRCQFGIESLGGEILQMNHLRDFRSKQQKKRTKAILDAFPSTSLTLSFDGEWQSALITIFLPSILVIFLVFFAQWKRRKVQVLVSIAAIICLLVMLTGLRSYGGATLLDLWLSGCFLHAAFLLAIDLILPARRVRYSLMVPIDKPERQTVHIMTKRNSSNNPIVSRLEKLAERTVGRFRDYGTTSELVTACPGETPIQRQVTSATLGERKRLALLAIASSFFTFMIIFLLLVLTIE